MLIRYHPVNVRTLCQTQLPRALAQAAKRQRLCPPRATAEDGSGEQKPDIDALAAFLTKRAVEMKASMDELDIIMSQEDSFAADEALDTADEEAAAALASADAAVPAGPAVPGEFVSRLSLHKRVSISRLAHIKQLSMHQLLVSLPGRRQANQPTIGTSSSCLISVSADSLS